MSRAASVKRILTIVLLGLVLWSCLVVGRWLSNSAPVIRWKLGQTVRSLPAVPEGVTLLGQSESDDSGTDCIAYGVLELYGTERAFSDVVRYYERALTASGWRLLDNHKSGSSAGFKRGRDEFLGLLTGDWVDLYRWQFRGLSAERLAEFRTVYRTVYILDVTRTCDLDLTELAAP